MAGKIASGRSTLAKSLASDCSAILLSKDLWLSLLIRSKQCSITYGFRGCWSSPLFPLHRIG
jgi:predicted kinase